MVNCQGKVMKKKQKEKWWKKTRSSRSYFGILALASYFIWKIIYHFEVWLLLHTGQTNDLSHNIMKTTFMAQMKNWVAQESQLTLMKKLSSSFTSAMIDGRKTCWFKENGREEKISVRYFCCEWVSGFLWNKESQTIQIGKHESVCCGVQMSPQTVTWCCHAGLPSEVPLCFNKNVLLSSTQVKMFLKRLINTNTLCDTEEDRSGFYN